MPPCPCQPNTRGAGAAPPSTGSFTIAVRRAPATVHSRRCSTRGAPLHSNAAAKSEDKTTHKISRVFIGLAWSSSLHRRTPLVSWNPSIWDFAGGAQCTAFADELSDCYAASPRLPLDSAELQPTPVSFALDPMEPLLNQQNTGAGTPIRSHHRQTFPSPRRFEILLLMRDLLRRS